MNVSLITLHRVFNFGSVLQTYALQVYLTRLGHEVEIIDYKPKQISNAAYFWTHDSRRYKNPLTALAYNTAVFPKRFGRKLVFERWIKEHLNLTKHQYHSYEDIKANIPDADIYVTGSDQVWNSEYNRGVDPAFFLEYAPPGKPRIAYAASFGRTELHDYEIESIRQLIHKYQGISVRESSAIAILHQLGRDDAEHVLDPTLLLTHEEWQQIMEISAKVKEKYLLIYQLNKNSFMIETAVKLAKERNLKVVKLSLNTRKLPGVDYVFNNITPQDFLSLIHFADFVVTDSFHGVAFSVNFAKDIVVIPPSHYATRLLSLTEMMGLSARVITKEDYDLPPINRALVAERLVAERRKSYQYLSTFFS